jgi:hypothetical protein
MNIPLSISKKYPFPEFLSGRCEPDVYYKWLLNKADTLLKRDKARQKKYALDAGKSLYKQKIHEAVLNSSLYDPYSGEYLKWELISLWDTSHKQPDGYKKKFRLMPTIDHVDPNRLDFEICSWKINDAKSDMTREEFINMCSTVEHYKRTNNNERH